MSQFNGFGVHQKMLTGQHEVQNESIFNTPKKINDTVPASSPSTHAMIGSKRKSTRNLPESPAPTKITPKQGTNNGEFPKLPHQAVQP